MPNFWRKDSEAAWQRNLVLVLVVRAVKLLDPLERVMDRRGIFGLQIDGWSPQASHACAQTVIRGVRQRAGRTIFEYDEEWMEWINWEN